MKSRLVLILPTLLIPGICFAVEPDTFQKIPYVSEGSKNIESYISALYSLSIAVAAVLVVVRLMMAGVQYMLSEIVTDKEKAKKGIREALLGLLIILAAVTILQTINPNLVKLDFLSNASVVIPNATGSPSHQGIRGIIRSENPIVDSTFEGELGSLEHRNFISKCKEKKGQPVASASNVNKLECRFSE